MTIECYDSTCPEHDKEGPFCDAKECIRPLTPFEQPEAKREASQEPAREELEAFIKRAGFNYGWENLESWARRMAEQAVRESRAAPVPRAREPVAWRFRSSVVEKIQRDRPDLHNPEQHGWTPLYDHAAPCSKCAELTAKLADTSEQQAERIKELEGEVEGGNDDFAQVMRQLSAANALIELLARGISYLPDVEIKDECLAAIERHQKGGRENGL